MRAAMDASRSKSARGPRGTTVPSDGVTEDRREDRRGRGSIRVGISPLRNSVTGVIGDATGVATSSSTSMRIESTGAFSSI
jgi:hypothetical protein